MRLCMLHEGYWSTIPDPPYNMAKDKNKKKKRPKSILKHPEDRERFLKWSNGNNNRN